MLLNLVHLGHRPISSHEIFEVSIAMVMCRVKDETCLSNTSFMKNKLRNKLAIYLG
jgi:hypothetical protein